MCTTSAVSVYVLYPPSVTEYVGISGRFGFSSFCFVYFLLVLSLLLCCALTVPGSFRLSPLLCLTLMQSCCLSRCSIVTMQAMSTDPAKIPLSRARRILRSLDHSISAYLELVLDRDVISRFLTASDHTHDLQRKRAACKRKKKVANSLHRELLDLLVLMVQQ